MRVVGLAGGSASGKSTVARGVAEALGERCQVVSHDWYYRTIPARYAREPAQYNFDHPDALETDLLARDLDRLRAGEVALVPDYDFASHTRREREHWRLLEPRPVVLVEGILVLSDPGLRTRFDLSVFVSAPEAVRLGRRIARDVAERGRSKDQVLEQYSRTVGPMHEAFVEPAREHAHVVLDGTRDPQALVAELLRHLG